VVPIIFKGVNIIVIFDQRICQTFAKIAWKNICILRWDPMEEDQL
jgi:hypothetical protein